MYTASAGSMGESRFVLIVLLAWMLLAAIAAPFIEPVLGVVLATAFATCVLTFALSPRKYEIWPQHLAFVFPLWRWMLNYEDIEEVRHAQGTEPHQRYGLRFVTISGRAVTISMRRGFLGMKKIVISPEDRDAFLRELERAMGYIEQRPS